jgi:DNA-binding MarR family transcriptional regulator
MPLPSDARLLVLHGLRLKGVASSEAVADAVGLPRADVAVRLDGLAAEGLVERRQGRLPGWTLTPAGRSAHERLLAREADRDSVRPRVEGAYGRFRELNPDVLDVVSRWQVRDVGGRPVRNDHRDPVYDDAVVRDLAAIHGDARPVCDRLAGTLDRYRPYGPRLTHAVDRVRAGDTDYFAKPMIPSYHTVWFELHEDLLATLGIDRAAEARLA